MSNPMQPQQPQVEIDLDAYVQTLAGQRSQALDTVAQQQGRIVRLEKRVQELEQKLLEARHTPPMQLKNGEEVRAT